VSADTEINWVPELKKSDIWKEIGKLHYLLSNSEHLRSDTNTNLAECFMSVNSRLQGAKKVNRANRGAYAKRTDSAALKFNQGPMWAYNSWKKKYGESLNVQLKKCSSQRQIK
jgi:hypothetical protein